MPHPRALVRLTRRLPLSQFRHQSTTTTTTPPPPTRTTHDPHALLSTPAWSIRTLLPQPPSPSSPLTSEEEEIITPPQLAHLHRLSALPQPSTPSQTASILSTLHSQLHFVRDIQRVNTDGIEPLHSIRDETAAGLREATITTETLRETLASEDTVGKCKRPRRRRKTVVDGAGVEDWDVMGCAGQKVGRYFVVRSGKEVKEGVE